MVEHAVIRIIFRYTFYPSDRKASLFAIKFWMENFVLNNINRIRAYTQNKNNHAQPSQNFADRV